MNLLSSPIKVFDDALVLSCKCFYIATMAILSVIGAYTLLLFFTTTRFISYSYFMKLSIKMQACQEERSSHS